MRFSPARKSSPLTIVSSQGSKKRSHVGSDKLVTVGGLFLCMEQSTDRYSQLQAHSPFIKIPTLLSLTSV